MERWQDVYRNPKLRMTSHEQRYAYVLKLHSEGLSTSEIVNTIDGIDRATVFRYINRGAKPREINHVEITSGLLEYMDGLMLGDGFMGHASGYNMSPRYVQSFAERYKGWALMIKDQLMEYWVESKIEPGWTHDKYGQRRIYYLRTPRYYEFTTFRRRWYEGNKGYKHLPDDLAIISPLTLFNWYLGDGNLYINTKYHSVTISLAALSFSLEELARLRFILERMHFGPIRYRKHNGLKCPDDKGREIIIGTKRGALNFFEFLERIPKPKCFEYKFDYSILLRNYKEEV